MAIDNKFTRWDDTIHHPNERCDATVANGPCSGQCPYIKVENTNRCPMHGYNSPMQVQQDEVKRTYRLRHWQRRMEEFADDNQIKSLREEIGILRIVMEEILHKCEDSTDLLMMSNRISNIAMQIEKLVVSCDKLEGRMGMLLSKRAVIQLAAQFVEIINTYVDDPEIIEGISENMLKATREIELVSEK
jgi:hypothetical protein